MNNSIKEWFSFSKKERVGIIALIVIMTIFLLLPTMFDPKLPPILVDSINNVSHFKNEPIKQNFDSAFTETETVAIKQQLFYFDPNLITEKGWAQIGLKEKTIRTILKYRSKGGKFRVAADLKKIWGLLPEDAERLMPYVQIKQTESTTANVEYVTAHPKIILDINEASASDWESLPGIGPVLANRIIHFRNKLGGFNSVELLKNTYGITDSIYKLILPNLTIKEKAIEPSIKAEIGLVNINKADEASLIRVGIDESIAKAIVLYRKQYGKYQQISDLKKIVFINETVFQQIIPKLTLN